MPRKIKPEDVTFTLRIEPEDIPVRGNYMASGDDEAKRDEDAIIERLDAGDLWAWCYVIVEARLGPLVGRDTLGGCSYADEADFRTPGGYFDDMKDEALADLQKQIDELAPLVCAHEEA